MRLQKGFELLWLLLVRSAQRHALSFYTVLNFCPSAYVCTKHDDLRQNISIELDCNWFGNFCKSGKKEKRGIAKTNFGNSHFCPGAVRVHKKWWFATNISIELDCVNGCFHFWKSDQKKERNCIAGKVKIVPLKKFNINTFLE